MREKRDKAALPQAIRSVTYLSMLPPVCLTAPCIYPFDAFLHLYVMMYPK